MENGDKKIFIIGSGIDIYTLTAEIQALKAIHGNDIVIVAYDDAVKQGLFPKPIEFKILPIPIIEELRILDIPCENKKANQVKQRRYWNKSNVAYSNKFSKRR